MHTETAFGPFDCLLITYIHLRANFLNCGIPAALATFWEIFGLFYLIVLYIAFESE